MGVVEFKVLLRWEWGLLFSLDDWLIARTLTTKRKNSVLMRLIGFETHRWPNTLVIHVPRDNIFKNIPILGNMKGSLGSMFSVLMLSLHIE